jgi:hypothetical protein
MIQLKSILESINFSNWRAPSISDLKREFHVEHELKGLECFESEKDFINACKRGKLTSITKDMNSNIGNRSNTRSFAELLGLIKSYRSYPKYRNEDTLRGLYGAFKENKEMDLPIILKDEDGSMSVFSGNTRLDVAFQLGLTPKALVVSIQGEL